MKQPKQPCESDLTLNSVGALAGLIHRHCRYKSPEARLLKKIIIQALYDEASRVRWMHRNALAEKPTRPSPQYFDLPEVLYETDGPINDVCDILDIDFSWFKRKAKAMADFETAFAWRGCKRKYPACVRISTGRDKIWEDHVIAGLQKVVRIHGPQARDELTEWAEDIDKTPCKPVNVFGLLQKKSLFRIVDRRRLGNGHGEAIFGAVDEVKNGKLDRGGIQAVAGHRKNASRKKQEAQG